jgi:hypothetical protein
MPRVRPPGQPRTKVKIIEFTWCTFTRFDGKTLKDKAQNALLDIVDRIGVKCEVNFGTKKKGIYEGAKHTTYMARFTSKSAFKIELACMIILAEEVFTNYNLKANENYRKIYCSTYRKESESESDSDSDNISEIGDSEYDSVFESENEYWEETCEICGTKKTSETPFEVTKCRNLDISIVDNMIHKMRQFIENVYSQFREDNYKYNKIKFKEMLEKFSDFIIKFTKYSKFSFSHQCNLQFLLHALTKREHVKKYTYEQIIYLNQILVKFINTIKSTPLPG